MFTDGQDQRDCVPLFDLYFPTFVCFVYIFLYKQIIQKKSLPFCNVVFSDGQNQRGGIVCSCLICDWKSVANFFLLLSVLFTFFFTNKLIKKNLTIL